MIYALMTAALILSPEADTRASPGAAIDTMHAAASRADGATYFGTFTADARFIGTDAGERWSLAEFKAYAEPYFARGQGWTYRVTDRHLEILDQPCQCVAVFDELLDNDSYGQVRGSGVVVKQGEDWKIQQYVLSFTVPNDKARDVVAVIKAD
ncbi:nuclear transport factor 2 family protein [Brevundimonas sp.]|uniref:nuclear transport factor 2 family protein n=1 Tax=Brevundimonas sp. TaxID=1871086 RepID=UPI00289D0684|nr:nuclear transport factor 2 family protein [Brevundimonas sp.]